MRLSADASVPVTPASGAAVDPLVEEISWAAWRVTGAAGFDEASTATLLHHRTRLVAQTLWDPGRTVLLSQARRTGGAVIAEFAVGCLGEKGATAADLRAVRMVVRALLTDTGDLPLAMTEVDPAEVLKAPLENAVDHGVIRQRVVPVDLGVGAARVEVLSRFNRMPNAWLAAMRVLATLDVDTTIRVTALSASLDAFDHSRLLRTAHMLDRSIASQSNWSGPLEDVAQLTHDYVASAPRLRLERARRTVHDLIESYSSLAYVCEVAYISAEHVAPIARRSFAGAFTSEFDIAHQGEVTSVANSPLMMGGFDIEVQPEGQLEALSEGLPLRGGAGARDLRDLVTLAELPFGLPAPDSSGLPGTNNRIAHGRPVPEALRSGEFIGRTPAGAEVCLPDDLASRHGLYIGTTGCGKSTRLVKAALTDMRAGRAIVFIDPHGTAVLRLRQHLAAENVPGQVHVVSLNGGTTGWRPFEALPADPEDRSATDDAIASIGEFIAAVRSSIPREWTGPRFDQLARAITTMAAAHGVHIRTALEWFIEPQTLSVKVRHSAISPSVRQALLRSHSSGTDGVSVLDWVVSKFSGISEGSLSRLLATPARGLTGSRLLNDGASLLVDLSGLPEQDAALFGHLVLSGVLNAAMSTPASNGLNIYVDEAQRFPVPGLTRILTEGRKFSASVHLATQSLATLQPELADAASGAATVFAFRQSADSAQKLGQLLGVPPTELLNLPDLTAAIKLGPHSTTTVVLDPYEDLPETEHAYFDAPDSGAIEPEWLQEAGEAPEAITLPEPPARVGMTVAGRGQGGLVSSWRQFSAFTGSQSAKDGD